MNELNKAELRRLAEASTGGDWEFRLGLIRTMVDSDGYVPVAIAPNCPKNWRGQRDTNMEYIAAANPAVVLSLLDQCEKAESERYAALAEREELRRLLDCFVRDESEPDENQSERHMYVTEAQSLLAYMGGEIKAHTLVPDDVLRNQSAELEAYKNQLRALIHISDATCWERHSCGEIAKARKLLEQSK